MSNYQVFYELGRVDEALEEIDRQVGYLEESMYKLQQALDDVENEIADLMAVYKRYEKETRV